jgi:hypothetical protein
VIALPLVIFMLAQAVYHLVLKDDGREEIVWRACVKPGSES